MRWDHQSLEERIKTEARIRQFDLSKYITVKEAMIILNRSHASVMRKFNWLEGATFCGRHFVKRNRAEWLAKWRLGQIPDSDRMGESLADFDVHAWKAEIRKKKE